MLIITKGLPGSGKTTWATAYVLDHPAGSVVRVNRDSLRQMLHAGRFKGRKTESVVVSVQLQMVETLLVQKLTVIVDDTNLNPSTEARLRELATRLGVQVTVEDFTDVSVEVCIAQDLKREHSVGERVIRRMHRQYLAQPVSYNPNPLLPHAVICDIDGTVAIMGNHRGPYEFSKVLDDEPNLPIIHLAQRLGENADLVFVSGRDDSCLDDTRRWIAEHLGFAHEEAVELYMRKTGDKRSDYIVKREIFEAHIAPRYCVDYVLDDRNSVVDMWRSLGLTVLQVADGDF